MAASLGCFWLLHQLYQDHLQLDLQYSVISATLDITKASHALKGPCSQLCHAHAGRVARTYSIGCDLGAKRKFKSLEDRSIVTFPWLQLMPALAVLQSLLLMAPSGGSWSSWKQLSSGLYLIRFNQIGKGVLLKIKPAPGQM